ncbi:hypothetical protein BJF79_47745 [Actinomadura sp. CNU-125]|uniref:hypothetical protein n=1 Tax=Actinomadura sp. CNU-125 TaxID=1904961 RepID=UPI0009661548|nr:hypothetical protein [Actinomadura sp. CNU-125]OLT19491.1 hypothetical protein BJF79_47745 [Actinomadura sp. CNU-125]
MRRSDKIAFAVLGIGVCAVLGGITLIGRFTAPPDTLADLCPADVTGTPGPLDLEADPAPYEGPGPHPVLLEPNPTGVPAAWRSGDESSIQLVACTYSRSTDQYVRTCEYTGGNERRLMRTEYTVRVFEARTSEAVGQFRVGDTGECPYSILERYAPGYEPSVPGTVGSSADYEALTEALRPYVEQPAVPH